MRLVTATLVALFFTFAANAQVADSTSTDSTSFKHFLRAGQFHVQANAFFVATDNEAPLKDFYCVAAGAGASYETARWKGFQVGAGGFFTYGVNTNISKPDSLTGAPSRYEVLLLDVEHPSRRDALRFEQLYLKYNLGKSFAQVGRFVLQTPFVNKQEGRMRPTAEEGVWLEVNQIKNLKLQAGWLWAISPRATTRWFSMPSSVGVYPVGVDVYGVKSKYQHNIKSSGVALVGAGYRYKNFKVDAWDNFFENVLNTSLLQIEQEKKLKDNERLFVGAMWIHEETVNRGGNADSSKTYSQRENRSNVISARAGFASNRFNASLNYTYITNESRYLNPREWGYDPFYTFMQRELNEGFGGVHALVVKTEWYSKSKSFRVGVAYGQYRLPDVKNYRLNKYGMPSYDQLNVDFRYAFAKTTKGLSVQGLLVYKGKQAETYGNERYVINKVNLFNYNVALDYSF